MASGPRGTSSPKSAVGRGGACSPSHGRAMRPGRPSPARWAPNGRADRTRSRPSRSTPPSYSRRPAFPYSVLWEERSVASVANLTRADGHEFLAVATQAKVRTTTTPYPLDKANEALDDLRSGRLEG